MKRFLIISVLSLILSNSILAQTNCRCCGEDFRQFDFWIGEWSVTNNNSPAGENSITMAQDSCLLVENWTSAAPGYSGTSYNYYDPATKKWYQTWVDNQGGNLRISGNWINGSMILMSEPAMDKTGKITINKISWTPQDDGTVRQHWQVSNDLGGTWNTAFNGIYSRKKK